jgi:hypothetical protein
MQVKLRPVWLSDYKRKEKNITFWLNQLILAAGFSPPVTVLACWVETIGRRSKFEQFPTDRGVF